MADSISKFHDASERAPVGGWHYFYDPSDGSTMFKLGSADEVIEELVRFRSNNRTFTTREAIEREVWRYYCSRHPDRCGQTAPAEGAKPFLPLDQQPEFFGPIIWRFLNLAASRFEFIGRDAFMLILQHVLNLMACPDCRNEWATILATNPPTAINTTKDACRWVNEVHNLVNVRKGKSLFTYEQMVTDYGAPLP